MSSGQSTKSKSIQIFNSVRRLQEEHDEHRNLLNTGPWGFYDQSVDMGSSGINDGYPV